MKHKTRKISAKEAGERRAILHEHMMTAAASAWVDAGGDDENVIVIVHPSDKLGMQLVPEVRRGEVGNDALAVLVMRRGEIVRVAGDALDPPVSEALAARNWQRTRERSFCMLTCGWGGSCLGRVEFDLADGAPRVTSGPGRPRRPRAWRPRHLRLVHSSR